MGDRFNFPNSFVGEFSYTYRTQKGIRKIVSNLYRNFGTVLVAQIRELVPSFQRKNTFVKMKIHAML